MVPLGKTDVTIRAGNTCWPILLKDQLFHRAQTDLQSELDQF